MADNRLEFKITHDLDNKDVQLENMSLEIAQAFVVLIQSVAGIVELTPKNKNLKISIRKGSAVVCVEGPEVKILEKRFKQVIENKSSNGELVKKWRNIQTLLSNNGIGYEANFFEKNKPVSILAQLTSSKKIRAKRKENPPIATNIEFMSGKLIAVGGKNPNIHVEISKNEKPVIIGCTELKANKAKVFLYNKIWLSVWSTKKGNDTEYEMCDSYWDTQSNIFNDFSSFIIALGKSHNEIESLKMLHYKCQEILISQNYGIYRKFLRLFNTETSDLNTLKTLLIVSRPFKEHERLKAIIDELDTIFQKKLAKI